MPLRRTVKETGLPRFKSLVQAKVNETLKEIPWLNTSVDLWTDDTTQTFHGYIAQGIYNNWDLITIPIEFDTMIGKFLIML